MRSLLLSLVLAAASASAQNTAPNLDRDSQDPARRAAAERKAAEAAEAPPAVS